MSVRRGVKTFFFLTDLLRLLKSEREMEDELSQVLLFIIVFKHAASGKSWCLFRDEKTKNKKNVEPHGLMFLIIETTSDSCGAADKY